MGLNRQTLALPEAGNAFGAGDFTLDMNINWTPDELEFLSYRSAVVLASRAAGLEPPLDTVWVDLRDKEGFVQSVQRIQNMGFQGKLCIHPDQVPVVNSAFTPNSEYRGARAGRSCENRKGPRA